MSPEQKAKRLLATAGWHFRNAQTLARAAVILFNITSAADVTDRIRKITNDELHTSCDMVDRVITGDIDN